MYRFAYLIPRLILLGLAFLAASIAVDTIAQRLVTAHLESTIGMDVEIGRFRTRASSGKVFVNDLALVDPQWPLANVFQADLAFLEIDLSAVAKRQLVIENARASQVRLGVPRTSAVSNPAHCQQPSLELGEDESASEDSQFVGFSSNLDVIRMAWIDQFETELTPAVVEPEKPEDNQLYQLASATNKKWNRDFQQQNGRLEVVSSSFAKLKQGLPSEEEIQRNGIGGPPNPLRQQSRNQPQPSELDDLIESLELLQRQQEKLERQATADIAHLETVYRNESEPQDQPKTSGPKISPENLSQLLLVDLHQSIANEAMNWFAGLRNSTHVCPDKTRVVGEMESCDRPMRGEVVDILGAPRNRPTLIKKLTFDGAGRFNQRHFNFAGEAFDITDQPETNDRPTTFKLRAQGDHHFVVQGSVDRRSGVCSDSVTIDFPAFPLGPRNLGTESEMLITTGPRTTTQGTIHLQIDGQAVSGTMRLDFSDVALVVEHLHDIAGGKEVALRLNQSLATLQQFESTAVFGGTLEQPQLEFESNLGTALANAIAQINSGKVSEGQVANRNAMEHFYKNQVLPLRSNIETELDSISRSIDSQIAVVQKMRTSLRAAKSRWPEVR